MLVICINKISDLWKYPQIKPIKIPKPISISVITNANHNVVFNPAQHSIQKSSPSGPNPNQ
jgi:hypothetical protein